MRKSLIFGLMLLVGASGCGEGKRPFRMVQFCLASPQDFAAMQSVLRRVASANELPFHDRSKETEAELLSAAEVQKSLIVARPTVNMGTVGPDAMGFSAGNFPESPSQIVVGFSDAGDRTVARKLSDDVVRALSRHWHVHEVPHVDTSGASPLKHCD